MEGKGLRAKRPCSKSQPTYLLGDLGLMEAGTLTLTRQNRGRDQGELDKGGDTQGISQAHSRCHAAFAE